MPRSAQFQDPGLGGGFARARSWGPGLPETKSSRAPLGEGGVKRLKPPVRRGLRTEKELPAGLGGSLKVFR
jgi:hypothetical protein